MGIGGVIQIAAGAGNGKSPCLRKGSVIAYELHAHSLRLRRQRDHERPVTPNKPRLSKARDDGSGTPGM